MFGFGGTELMVVLLIVLLLFGPSQLPKMARGFGQAIREFKRAQREVSDELQREDPKPPTPPSDNKPIQ
ncbi:MAG: twin-arginine translocase TatA/TatE family subunit [Candidatus Eisenbacteria bacterium]|uniref:Sec-independent protein translocase protein TatA n=1 Tax=Eiseniibacteriota bacterium TaxID=2212470 RepID=A0A933SAL4_UNCEI|nr:twin-arginine translocase TatA/TatE family subunit [Candidatus Eisenbacteria bacterium]